MVTGIFLAAKAAFSNFRLFYLRVGIRHRVGMIRFVPAIVHAVAQTLGLADIPIQIIQCYHLFPNVVDLWCG